MSVRHASRSVVDALPLSRSSTYICRQCRRNAHPSQILTQQRQYASERTDGLPLAERVRRKLWKGKPPGPENVDELYGGPGALETMFKERRERRTQTRTRSADPPAGSQAPVDVPQSDAQDTESRPQQEQETRGLAQPARTREVHETMAAQMEPQIEEQESVEDPNYVQATTWDGLQIMGHKGHWKEMPYRQKDEYTSWLPPQVRKEWSYTELVSLMHQAIVESYALEKSKVPFKKFERLNSNSPLNQRELENATFRLDSDGTIESVEGLGILKLPFHASCYIQGKQEELKPYSHDLEAALIARTEPELKPLEPRLSYTPTDTTFLDASLQLTKPVTFHIFKRFAKLMNHTIPDPLISDLASTDPAKNTIRSFLTSMAEKTKKKDAKVAELLTSDPKLAEVGNLLVLGRRETPVDKEKEVGRWKVIEAELKSRGLPALGRVEIQR